MSTTHTAFTALSEEQKEDLSLLLDYPEVNPFTTDLPLHNLTPQPVKGLEWDTPELHDAARAVANKKGINLLAGMYGTNPLIIMDMSLYSMPIPMRGYRKPPPLPEVELPEDTVFIAELSKNGNTPLFKVLVHGKIMLLKIFPDHSDEDDDEYSTPERWMYRPRRDGCQLNHLKHFERESAAYAHLVHYDVCRKGIVPHCHGWLTLSQQHAERIGQLGGISVHAICLKLERPSKCLLLEFIDDAVPLKWQEITEELADKTLRGLYEVHTAYVQHRDVNKRNILVCADGRIVWIDFDCAATPFRGDFEKGSLLRELEECWGYLYAGLLPNKRIGWCSPWQ